ncbi:MAG: hypothetical protein JRI72_00085 [Deltaproteobacteria bacterium]|nr:hypothetical protein [Deltaproteobacteria bacterium]
MYWKPLKFKTSVYTNTFGSGINTFLTSFEIQDGELTDCLNMCSDDLPAIRTRNDRVPLSSGLVTTEMNGLGEYNNTYIHALDGKYWKYFDDSSNWVNLSSSLNSTEGFFDEFVRGTDRRVIMMNGTQQKYWMSSDSSALDFSDTNMPFTKLFCIHKSRMYALDDNDLWFSGLNDPTDWSSTGAGYISIVNSVGLGTAIKAYNDHVIVWSGNSMHELYGTNPDNYELKDITNDVGCVGQKTVAEVKGRLFWLDYTGIYLYTGGLPRKVSDKVKKYIDGINWAYVNLCAAGVKDNKYFLSIPYNSTELNRILVYDTYAETWTVQSGNFNHYINIQDVLYGMETTTYRVWNMESTLQTGQDNSTDISWEFVTKAYNDRTISGKKTLSDMYMITEGSSGATIKIDYSTNINSTNVNALYPSTNVSTEISSTQLNIPTTDLQNINWYKLQFSGTRHVKIHSIEKKFRVKMR